MSARKKDRPTRRGWRSVAVLTGCVAVVAGAGYWVRSALLPRADAQTNVPAVRAPATAAPAPATQEPLSDYSRRVVAYVYDAEPITREQLGEYLIDRYGDKLDLLINKRIIDETCRQYNIDVTASEVESALTEELQGLAIDQKTFVNTLLARYHKNLYEWKEDVVRSRLQMAKLCRSRAQISEDEIRKAFESLYGEKVECQIILWPKGERGEADALADYARLRDNPDAFDQKAKAQIVKRELAATAGKVRPFGRYVMGDDNFDRIVFRLKHNEISEIIKTNDGPVLVKCLRHYPADTSITLDSVREKLVKQLLDKKVATEMQKAFQTLKAQAHPEIKLKKKNKADEPDGLQANESGPRSRQVVAVYNGQTPITREDFGEFLIARYGAEKIDFLINRRLIDKECQAHNIGVTPEEIEAGLSDDLKKLSVDLKQFEKDFLGPYNKNLYEWREDVIRPRLLMSKLCRDRVKVTEAELKLAFDARFGEKVQGHMILWPADQVKFALMEYTQIRDNPKAFEEKAKSQTSSTLAAKGGAIGPFGRHTLGNEDVEREAFKLQPGDITTLIGTPEGNVVFKLDKRIPANTSVTLESKRAELTQEVFERKVQMEMQTAFRDLRAAAKPKVMLKDSSKPADLTTSTKKLLSSSVDEMKMNTPNTKH
ncbi:MAG TPA: peptidylprolyl isomerase [Gemmataceae bacterium]|nr:peptidylprolyl isomerase [Gemmataceae bacterium]